MELAAGTPLTSQVLSSMIQQLSRSSFHMSRDRRLHVSEASLREMFSSVRYVDSSAMIELKTSINKIAGSLLAEVEDVSQLEQMIGKRVVRV